MHMSQRKELTDLLASLVRVPSVTDDHARCREALEIAQAYLADAPNMTFTWDECAGSPSLIAGCNAKSAYEYDIILNAHLDVVDAPAELFEPVLEGDVMKGRGAFDMKSAATAILMALKEHAFSGSKLSVAAVLTTDEETGGENGVKYLTEHKNLRARCAVVPDGGGPDFALIVSQKGGMWIEVLYKGKSAHASTPEKGVNAILSFMEDYRKLEKEIARIPESTVSLSSIAGSGPAVNAVPDLCEAKLDMRSPHPEKLLAAAEVAFAKGDVRVIHRVSTFRINEDDPFTHAFVAAMEEATGREVMYKKETGGSDARHFADASIPTIAASIEGSGLHGLSERVSIPSIEDLQRTLEVFLAKAQVLCEQCASFLTKTNISAK